MELSSELISQFVKITNDTGTSSTTTTLYGTIVSYDDRQWVRLDGSDLLTPITTTASVTDDERVTVTIENHVATVTGNVTSPSASSTVVEGISGELSDLGTEVAEFETIIAQSVSTERLDAELASITELIATKAEITDLEATNADIENLTAENAEITGKLTAVEAEIDTLTTNMLTTEILDAKYATIESLEATNADIHVLTVDFGDFKVLTSNTLSAHDAYIKDLQANQISVTDLEAKFANIDFANITELAVENLFAMSGIIGDMVIEDGHVTGELIGVTIKGDLIEANTLVADALIIKGTNGLFYKLNTDGVSLSAEQTEYNSLSGSVITAKSVTADKITVSDLYAFEATIGGFLITDSAIHSVVKTSALNTTRGIYMDNDGQMSFGDASNYVRFYKDEETSQYKLEISAASVTIGASSTNIEDAVDDLQSQVDNLEGMVTLSILSSHGSVFRNNNASTTLMVFLYYGSTVIDNVVSLASVFGSDAYLQWYVIQEGADGSEKIAADDSRLSDGGFVMTLSSDDVSGSATFTCELIV